MPANPFAVNGRIPAGAIFVRIAQPVYPKAIEGPAAPQSAGPLAILGDLSFAPQTPAAYCVQYLAQKLLAWLSRWGLFKQVFSQND
jgi:hypothetical protein